MDGSASSDADAAAGDDDDSATPASDLDYNWHLSLIPADSALDDGDIFYQGTANPILIPDVSGTYIMQLRVDDGSCTSAPDYLTLLADSGNLPPVANAGESIVLTPCAPTEVVLDGTMRMASISEHTHLKHFKKQIKCVFLLTCQLKKQPIKCVF